MLICATQLSHLALWQVISERSGAGSSKADRSKASLQRQVPGLAQKVLSFKEIRPLREAWVQAGEEEEQIQGGDGGEVDFQG